MGCVCCSLSSFISILLDALERISLCTVCAMLTCCLLFTIITVMVMGIGIGYHYCFVQNSVDAMAKAAKAAGALRTGGGQGKGSVMRSVDKAVRRGFTHRRNRREMNGSLPDTNSRNGSSIQPQNLTDYDQYVEADYEINNDTSNNDTYVLSTAYQNFTTLNITNITVAD